jgi:3' terminal RNA ribose 2'-O-methyltransferase Hen1
VLLTITSTVAPATDLGYLLHKHPDRHQSFGLAAGQAHVFYPEASEQRCTAALLLEVDPVGLTRGQHAGRAGGPRAAAPQAFSLAQYVNDRPYAVSSMMSVALGKVFGTAMSGRCAARPELAARELPLEISIPALPCRGGAGLAQRLLVPLGWTVRAQSIPLDPQLPQWGDSAYLSVQLSGTMRLSQALSHLYVLLPVLDNAKHYWVSDDEVDKLIRAGGGWLAGHPERDLITRRYLAHQRRLVRTAVGRLAEVDDTEPETLDNAVGDVPDAQARPPQPLAELRREAVLAELREAGAATVADLGCGEGSLVAMLLRDPSFRRILAVDVSPRALERTAQRLHLDRMPERQRQRVELLQSSLTYTDRRLTGLDAAVLMEVIEHVDPPRLGALEQAVFAVARPTLVLVTTPNAEHNTLLPGLAPGALRHLDHRFEWTRAQLRDWAGGVAGRHGYRVRYQPVGADDPAAGPPTQLAVFTRD